MNENITFFESNAKKYYEAFSEFIKEANSIEHYDARIKKIIN